MGIRRRSQFCSESMIAEGFIAMEAKDSTEVKNIGNSGAGVSTRTWH